MPSAISLAELLVQRLKTLCHPRFHRVYPFDQPRFQARHIRPQLGDVGLGGHTLGEGVPDRIGDCLGLLRLKARRGQRLGRV